MTSNVQKLREATSAGVMDCKKALEEAGGDFDRALKIIHEKGLTKVQKRAGRKTGAGLVHTYVHNERVGVIIEMRAETDFVARSEPFRELIHDLAMHVAAMDPKDTHELLAQKDQTKNIKDLVNELIAKVGENIEIGQFYRIEV
ncbi:MAG: translation elongation factor Ts [Candidatus Liptonbacteria bacterium]|nr:translation elongation factor Ts [Candidatus Liptonbacteria bacterium]